ncbi:hypothetical protein C9426_28555 [Serratia sp. S1B]|nr:hypothetical protein C9426_28555 [Serratia sp. S1B]
MSAKIRLIGTIIVFSLGLFSQPLLAHAHLKTVIPAKDATVSPAPQVLMLNFSEGIELNFSKVKVSGADNQAVKTGKLVLAPDNNKQLQVPIETQLMAGKYHVDWHIVSVDGHKTKGQYSFTVN